MEQVFDVTEFGTWLPVFAGVIIPFLVALIAKIDASGTVKSLLAAVGASLTALAVYIADESSVRTWAGAASIFIVTLIIAAASRYTLTEDKVEALAKKYPGGIG